LQSLCNIVYYRRHTGGARLSERKDRLIQTRVPETLETSLKREARRRRTTVSQMIRNILEDAFELVDGVVANVDQIVSDSVGLAQQVGRDARRRRGSVRDAAWPCREPLPGAAGRLALVQAWNPVVLNRSIACSRCGAELARGRRAYLGLADDASAPRAWLCARAVEALGEDAPRPPAEGEER
jgi:hypothetical protein